MTHRSDSLTSIRTRAMYGATNETPSREGFPKERRHADRGQGVSGGDRAGGAVQEAGPDLRGRRDHGGPGGPTGRWDGAQESVVGGEGRDGWGRLQRVALLECRGHGEAEGRAEGEGRQGEEGARHEAYCPREAGEAEGREEGRQEQEREAEEVEGGASGGEERRVLRLRRLRRDLPDARRGDGASGRAHQLARGESSRRTAGSFVGLLSY